LPGESVLSVGDVGGTGGAGAREQNTLVNLHLQSLVSRKTFVLNTQCNT